MWLHTYFLNRIVYFHYVFYFKIAIIYYSARELYTS